MTDYSFPALEKLQRSLARDCVVAFKQGGIDAVYAWASNVSPKAYPSDAARTPAAERKALDLYADCFLLAAEKAR